MKTIFPKKECHVPKWFVIDANGKTLGRLSTIASKLLRDPAAYASCTAQPEMGNQLNYCQ